MSEDKQFLQTVFVHREYCIEVESEVFAEVKNNIGQLKTKNLSYLSYNMQINILEGTRHEKVISTELDHDCSYLYPFFYTCKISLACLNANFKIYFINMIWKKR